MNPEDLPILSGETRVTSAISGQPRLIRFDRYVLDLRRGTLRLGEDDIEIRPKTFEVLKFLVENAGRLVSKDEIVAAVWPGVFVTDDSVVQCVKELRRALGQDGERLVRTVPRRGYRLEAQGVPNLAAMLPDSVERRADDEPGSMVGAAVRRSHDHLGLAAAVGFAVLLAICLWPPVIATRDAQSAAAATTPAAADERAAGLNTADMQRVTAIAAKNKLILPNFVINRPAASLPPQMRRYSGIWASTIAFGGGTGRQAMLIVTDVESDGTIMGYYVYGPPTPQTIDQSPAGFTQWLGKVSDGALTYQTGRGPVTVQFTGDNIFLVQNRTDGRRPTVTMEPVWRLADEERAAKQDQ